MNFGVLTTLRGKELSFFPGNLSSSGEPLDNSIRAFMEAPFAADFRNVRIHTGAWAAEAARTLSARAFTRGNDIYFGAGKYAPHKPEGRWLLAHELAHVIQQSRRRGTGCDGAPGLGGPHDSFETEANLAADRILKSEPLPPITPDDSGAIRRALTIVTSSAQITLNSSSAKATATATTDGKKMVCNLTQSFNPADPLASGDAFDASGAVDVIADDKSDVAAVGRGALKFAFVQIARVFFVGVFWAGRKTREGSVGMVVSNAPAWPQDKLISLDSQAAITPFVSPTRPTLNEVPQKGKILLQLTDIKMGDHPVHGGPLIMKNQKTVTDNFLFHLKEHVEYFTALVALDDKGVLTPLAHFRWETDYSARFNWRAGKPVLVSPGTATFDTPVQGGPTDPAISSALAAHTPPFTNDLHQDANKKSVTGGNPSNFSHNDKWFVNVPSDFWA